MTFVSENKRCNRKRRCIVITEAHGGASMVNCSEAILFAQSAATETCVEAPTQIGVCGTVVRLKFKSFLK